MLLGEPGYHIYGIMRNVYFELEKLFPTHLFKIIFDIESIPLEYEYLPIKESFLSEYVMLYQNKVLLPTLMKENDSLLPTFKPTPCESLFRIDRQSYEKDIISEPNSKKLFEMAKGIQVVNYTDLLSHYKLSVIEKKKERNSNQDPEDNMIGKRNTVQKEATQEGQDSSLIKKTPKRGRPKKIKEIIEKDKNNNLNQNEVDQSYIWRKDEMRDRDSLEKSEQNLQIRKKSIISGNLLDLHYRENNTNSYERSDNDSNGDPFHMFL